MDEKERRNRRREQVRVPAPDTREGDAESREHEVDREAVGGEEPGLTKRMPAREMKHRREEHMVGRYKDDARGKACEGHRRLSAQPEIANERHCPPRCEQVQRVIADVEALDVPGVANLQPLGNVLDDPHEHDELGRQ